MARFHQHPERMLVETGAATLLGVACSSPPLLGRTVTGQRVRVQPAELRVVRDDSGALWRHSAFCAIVRTAHLYASGCDPAVRAMAPDKRGLQ
jgi:hypothetical protein